MEEKSIIPYIVGWVALAATGYGVAKLLEDECSSAHLPKSNILKVPLGSFVLIQQRKKDDAYPTKEFYVELDKKAYAPQKDKRLGKYGDEDKGLVQKLITIFKLIDHVVFSNL